jgi:NhaP-type Na+/H+ or K+/H+ antiporter
LVGRLGAGRLTSFRVTAGFGPAGEAGGKIDKLCERAKVVLILVFGLTLFAAALISQLAERSVVSTAVLVLLAGFVAGPALLDLAHFDATSKVTAEVASLALFATLFSDGQRFGIGDVRRDWRPSVRALLIGIPLTVCGTCLLGRWFAGLSWREGFLLGAVLAPTDPVFAAAIVRQQGISERLRRLLNVESGVNDGLALPLVLIFLRHYSLGGVAHDLLLPLGEGLLLGVAVVATAHLVESSRLFRVHEDYREMAGFSLALIVLSLARVLKANEFLAAFAAGMTAISLRPQLSSAFANLVEQLANVLKFAGVFILGGLLAPWALTALHWPDLAFIVLSLVLVRPVALVPALWGERLTRREWIAAAWFGPKGFASVFYAVMIMQTQMPDAARLFSLAAAVIALSIVAHSSTDVVLARWLSKQDDSA